MREGTIGVRGFALALAAALLVQGVAVCAAAAAGPAQATEEARTAHTPPDPGDDPRLRRTGSAERAVRQAGDLVFARPFFLVQLVAGTALLPVALPVAAAFADWRDALDICVTGPWEMLVERPLGG